MNTIHTDASARKWYRVGCILLFLGLVPAYAHAQRPVYEAAVSTGSGLSFGPGNGRTVMLMSPMYVDIDVIYYNDERPKFELAVGFQAELQGRVSAGVVPQFRITTGPGPVMWYGLVGAPLVVAPFALFGLEAGGGFLWRFSVKFGVFAELVVDYFFLGSDLQESGVLIQLDSNLGIRMMF